MASISTMRAEAAGTTALKPENILTVEELAKRLKTSKNWVYEKTRDRGQYGEPLPVLKMGRFLRFDWEDVSRWLRSNREK
jgi:excisionase family DNA binding protein